MSVEAFVMTFLLRPDAYGGQDARVTLAQRAEWGTATLAKPVGWQMEYDMTLLVPSSQQEGSRVRLEFP